MILRNVIVTVCVFIFWNNSFGNNIFGNIYGRVNNLPVANACILLKDSIGSLVTFCYSDDLGFFSMQASINEGNFLEINALGYKTLIVEYKDICIPENGLVIFIESQSYALQEVLITSNKSYKISGDTISYNSESYSRGNEEVLEHLLRNIPGVTVQNDGKILLYNQEIEKLLIEGDDLFGRKYQNLSKILPSKVVQSIEIIRKYTENILEKNIKPSNKVAINIKIKSSFKRILLGDFNLGVSLPEFLKYNVSGNFMNFRKKSKFVVINNLTNIKFEDRINSEDVDYIPSDENLFAGKYSYINTNINIANQLPSSLPRQYIENTRDRFITLNAITNPFSWWKLKFVGSWQGTLNEYQEHTFNNIKTVNADFTNIETLDNLLDNSNFKSIINSTFTAGNNFKLYFETTFQLLNNIDSISSFFNLSKTFGINSGRKSILKNQVNLSKEFSKRSLLILKTSNTFEAYNSLLKSNTIVKEFGTAETASSAQKFKNDNTNLQVNGSYYYKFDRSTFNVIYNYLLNNSGFSNNFDIVDFTGRSDSIVELYSGNRFNIAEQSLAIGHTYKYGSFQYSSKFSLIKLTNSIRNSERLVSEYYINPLFSIDYRINNDFTSSIVASWNTINNDPNYLFANNMQINLRNISENVSDFYQVNEFDISLRIFKGSMVKNSFLSFITSYNLKPRFLSSNMNINSNITRNGDYLESGNKLFYSSLCYDRFFDLISSNLKLKHDFSYFTRSNIINGFSRILSFVNNQYSLEARSVLKSSFNFHIGARISMGNSQSEINRKIGNNSSFIDLVMNPIKNLKLNFKLERIQYIQLASVVKPFYITDFTSNYVFKNKKLSCGLTIQNLANIKTFTQQEVNDLSYLGTIYNVQPRFLLFNIKFSLK
jgi:hypothetical protein